MIHRVRQLLIASFVLMIVAVWSQPARADATSDVLRVVPAETSICFVVRDLRQHIQEFAESPFAQWFPNTPLGKRVFQNREFEKLKSIDQFLVDQLVLTSKQIVEDVIGDVIVLAYLPEDAAKSQEEAGVILLQARKAELLAQLIEKLNQLQRASGEIKSIQKKSFQNVDYLEREKAAGGKEFILLRGGLLAVSAQERAIHSVIERDRSRSQTPGKSTRVADGIAALGLSDTCAVCWFDPRSFDADLRKKQETTADPGQKAFLKKFTHLWAAVDGVALYAHRTKQLEFGVVVNVNQSRVPEDLRWLTQPKNNHSTLGSAIPENAIFATSGQLDVAKAVQTLGTFLPDDGKKGLQEAIEQGIGPLIGKEKLPIVINHIGPDWALWITPADRSATNWIPEFTGAIRIQSDASGQVLVSQKILQVADFLVQMFRVAHNREHKDHIEFGEETHEGVTIRILSNDTGFQPGLRPAYAIKQNFLIVSSSPDAIRRFQAPKPDQKPIAHPIVRISAANLREYLRNHRSAIAKASSKWAGKSEMEMNQYLDELLMVLEIVDRVEITTIQDKSRIRLSLKTEFTKPLQK